MVVRSPSQRSFLHKRALHSSTVIVLPLALLFLFVDPSEGVSAEILLMSGEVTFASARKELVKNQWKTAGLKFMKGMKMAKALDSKALSSKVMKKVDKCLDHASRQSLGEQKAIESQTTDDQEDNNTSVAGSDSDDDIDIDKILLKHQQQLDAKDAEIEALKEQLDRCKCGIGPNSKELVQKHRERGRGLVFSFEAAISAIEQVELHVAARKNGAPKLAPPVDVKDSF